MQFTFGIITTKEKHNDTKTRTTVHKKHKTTRKINNTNKENEKK